MKKKALLIQGYLIHGLILKFITNNRYIFSAVNELLEFFLPPKPLPLDPPDFVVSLFNNYDDAAPQIEIPSGRKLLYTSSEKDRFDIRGFDLDPMSLSVNDNGSIYYVTFGTIEFLSYNIKEGTADVYLKRPEAINPNIISSFIFIFVLAQLLKGKGHFLVHCSAVEKKGLGVIFPGFSGAGKTTSCIALIRKGYGFLGDDRPLLRYNKNHKLELLSFPEPIDVTDYTTNLFPELKNYDRFLHNRKIRKKSFNAEEVYPGTIRDSCVPRVILYPEICSVPRSYLENFPKSEALKSFLPHSLLAFDKDTTKQHFDIIFDLIQSTDCYKLKLGSDVENLPDLVESIL